MIKLISICKNTTESNKVLLEGFDLPPDIELECNRAGEFIASLFLSHFKTKIENVKTASPEDIVKYNEYYRLALKYRNNTKSFFEIRKSHGVNSQWGEMNFIINPKNEKFPNILLKISKSGYSESVDAYVEKDDPKTMLVLVETYNFINAFKTQTNYLKEVLKHEVRHSIQMYSKWQGGMVGLPKQNVKDLSRDVFGFNISGRGSRLPHEYRDIEFKPNVHTYAYHIKKYLNKWYPRNKWAEGFKDLLMGKSLHSFDRKIREIVYMFNGLRESDYDRWKLYVKELYKEIVK